MDVFIVRPALLSARAEPAVGQRDAAGARGHSYVGLLAVERVLRDALRRPALAGVLHAEKDVDAAEALARRNGLRIGHVGRAPSRGDLIVAVIDVAGPAHEVAHRR